MSNKAFGLPTILGVTPGGGSVEGPGSGTQGLDDNGRKIGKVPFACSFENWSESFRGDDFADGIIDFNDYGQWWADNGLGEDAWQQFNPEVPFNWQAKNR